ncbi:MAG: DUF4838 domain-containing protein [Promethearchaeota archaeon]
MTLKIKNIKSVVLAKDCSPSQNYAAEELIRYIEISTGLKLGKIIIEKELPTNVIVVGDHPDIPKLKTDINLEELGDEGYWISIDDDRIIIAGSKVRGALFGVYAFLEEFLGIRFYAPEAYYILKNNDDLEFPMTSKKSLPAFKYRAITYLDALDPEFSPTQKINLNPFAEPETGGSYRFSPTKMTHTFYSLVPPKKYYNDHPDYFSLVNGERLQQLGQLCLSNPEVQRVATETVLKWFEEEPDIMTVGVVQNDWSGYCQCEKCRAIDRGNPARILLIFCSKIAEKVKEKYPDKFIHTIAYTYTEKPPEDLEEELPDNLIIVVCNMYPYRSNRSMDEDPMNERYYNNLKGWLKIAKHVFVWHYFVDFTHYLAPYPVWQSISEDLKKYHELGVEGVLLQAGIGLGLYQEFQELKWWVFHKLLWDPNQNLNELIKDFIQTYYGTAAGTVQSFVDELMTIEKQNDVNLHLYVGLEGNHLKKDSIIKWQARFENALNKVKDSRDSKDLEERIEKILLGLDYVYLLIPPEFDVALGKIKPKDFNKRKLVLERFKSLTKKFKITTHGEQVPLKSFLTRQEFICRENDVLAIAELAPLVKQMLTALLNRVENTKKNEGYFLANSLITSAIKLGFNPIGLNNFMSQKMILELNPDVPDIWHRSINEQMLQKYLKPEIPNVHKSQLPKIVLDMIRGLPAQLDELDD